MLVFKWAHQQQALRPMPASDTLIAIVIVAPAGSTAFAQQALHYHSRRARRPNIRGRPEPFPVACNAIQTTSGSIERLGSI